MTPGQLDHLRTILQSRRQSILADRRSAEASARPVALDPSSVGRVSRVDALQGQTIALETQRRRAFELRRIEAALARIEDEAYGLCVECDEAIAYGRLEIDPATTRCIACASRAEQI